MEPFQRRKTARWRGARGWGTGFAMGCSGSWLWWWKHTPRRVVKLCTAKRTSSLRRNRPGATAKSGSGAALLRATACDPTITSAKTMRAHVSSFHQNPIPLWGRSKAGCRDQGKRKRGVCRVELQCGQAHGGPDRMRRSGRVYPSPPWDCHLWTGLPGGTPRTGVAGLASQC